MLRINVLCCCVCRVSWQRRGWAGGARAAAEGDNRALCPVGRCQRCHRWPKKPTGWQVQPHPGLRPLFFLFFFFFIRTLFYFLKINTPHHSLPPHWLVTFFPTSPALTLSRPWTPVSSPSTLKPFVFSFFLLKEENCWQKHFMYLSPPPPFQPIL